jgi:tetratricopeptide (TPR) repeat protein
MEANYQFMIEKAYFGALRNGGKARKHSQKLVKQYPDFVDAYLVLGVYEYVVGSLPWAIRAVIAIGGINGSKQKGEEYVRKVAEEGNWNRNEARSLLALLLRREKRPLQAAEVIRGLMRDFPRNYVLHLELGAMYQDAGEKDRALATFREVRSKVNRNEDRFGRMPARAVEALDRKIEKLAEDIQTANAGE